MLASIQSKYYYLSQYSDYYDCIGPIDFHFIVRFELQKYFIVHYSVSYVSASCYWLHCMWFLCVCAPVVAYCSLLCLCHLWKTHILVYREMHDSMHPTHIYTVTLTVCLHVLCTVCALYIHVSKLVVHISTLKFNYVLECRYHPVVICLWLNVCSS